MDDQPKRGRGGWREEARGKVGPKRKPDKLRPLPLRVPPALREAYDKADAATKAQARAAMIEALRTTLEPRQS